MEEASTKNLYIKSWFLSVEEIEVKLANLPLVWKRINRQFFFEVTVATYDEVKATLSPVNTENGSVIHESEIDYVTGSRQDIIRQLIGAYGIENVIVCHNPRESEEER